MRHLGGKAEPCQGRLKTFPWSFYISAREAGGRVWPRVERFLRNPGNIAKGSKPARRATDGASGKLPFTRFAGSPSLPAYPGFRKTRSTLGHTLPPAPRANNSASVLREKRHRRGPAAGRGSSATGHEEDQMFLAARTLQRPRKCPNSRERLCLSKPA